MSKNLVLSQEILPLIKDSLGNQQIVTLTVSGHSMRPFLKDKGSIVSVINEPFKKHDILLYTNENNTLVLHRLIKNTNPLVLCGDALKTKELIHPNNVLGKVKRIEYKGKIINPNTRFYRFKVKLWILLKPFRKILLKVFFRT